MRIHRIIERTRAEGPGARLAVWAQGCKSACAGCYARELWDMSGGVEMSADEIISCMGKARNGIEGITLLGGEPFLQAGELSTVAAAAQEQGLSVITFTGFVYEELISGGIPDAPALLTQTDLLIDGPYLESLRDFSRPLAGSKNQRFLFLTDRYSMEDIWANPNRIEIRMDKNGAVHANGMGDFSALERRLDAPAAAKGV